MTWFKLIITGLFALIITAPSMATHKLSMREARALAARAGHHSKFQFEMNDLILKQLNHFLSTPSKRKHLRICFKRMQRYRPVIQEKITRHNLPMELMAIPVIESSYENKHSKHVWGSGLWMFVKPTAKAYGLKINRHTDQRLNAKLSTDAALKYLKANHQRFDDWQLAILAYNVGEFRVKRGMEETGSKNAWKLIQAGYVGDKDYLAKVLAVMIIMKNPEVLGK